MAKGVRVKVWVRVRDRTLAHVWNGINTIPNKNCVDTNLGTDLHEP